MTVERILVTGGAGFIGSHSVDLLLSQGFQVTVVDDLSSGKLSYLNTNHPALRFVRGDILDFGLVSQLIRDCDAILHLAAIASVPLSLEKPIHTTNVNTLGTLCIFEAIRLAKRKIRLVYASSSAVYGDCSKLPCSEEMKDLNPTSPYALQKFQCEQFADLYQRNYGIDSLGLRYFNVYGPRQDPSSPYSGVISLFTDAYQQNREFEIHGDGKQSRDFIFVQDVAAANALALNSNYSGVLNIGTGKTQTLLDLVNYIEKAGNRAAKYRLAAARPGDIRHSYGEIVLQQQALNFRPEINLQDGIQILLQDVVQ